MRSTQLRVVIIDQPVLIDVLVALELLRSGQPLTAGESGTIAYNPISELELVGDPQMVWNGISYVFVLKVSSG
jgi:hypothetical protein